MEAAGSLGVVNVFHCHTPLSVYTPSTSSTPFSSAFISGPLPLPPLPQKTNTHSHHHPALSPTHLRLQRPECDVDRVLPALAAPLPVKQVEQRLDDGAYVGVKEVVLPRAPPERGRGGGEGGPRVSV